jgi:hypothetical protein
MRLHLTPSRGDGTPRRIAGGAVAAIALAGLAIAGAVPGIADETGARPDGAGSSVGGSPARAVDLGTIRPSLEFRDASFVASGVGLRNQARGGITISGATGTPLATYVYWASITEDAPSSSAVRVTRTSPGPQLTTSVKGTVVGRGPSPCWAGTTLTVFRGPVNATVATGNGTYEIELVQPGVLTGGQDPWDVTPPPGAPYAEGASMLVVYPDRRSSVSVFDRSANGGATLAGQMFLGNSGYTLERNIPSAGPIARFAEIGADGQTGQGHRAFGATAVGQTTTFNGRDVAGGDSGKGSDWDGDDGNPLPQLWDTHIHDVRGLLGDTIDTVAITSQVPDCLSYVASVIAG